MSFPPWAYGGETLPDNEGSVRALLRAGFTELASGDKVRRLD